MPIDFKVLEAEFLPSLHIVMENSTELLSEQDGHLSEQQQQLVENIYTRAEHILKTIIDEKYRASIFDYPEKALARYWAFGAEFATPINTILHGSRWLIENPENVFGVELSSVQITKLTQIMKAGQLMKDLLPQLHSRDI